MNKYTNIDEYINSFPKEIQSILQKIRETIHKAAPDASEAISYGLATFKLNGNLVHFGGFKSHIGFYPTPSGTEAFQNKIKKYKFSKGTIQFSLDEPIPYDLITEITKFRVNETKNKGMSHKSEFEIPEYFLEALALDDDANELFEKLSASHQNEYIKWISEAKTDKTRNTRIKKTIEMIKEKKLEKIK